MIPLPRRLQWPRWHQLLVRDFSRATMVVYQPQTLHFPCSASRLGDGDINITLPSLLHPKVHHSFGSSWRIRDVTDFNIKRCGVLGDIKSSGHHVFQFRLNSSYVRIPRMSDCQTLEEAIDAIYDNLDIVAHRDLAAFWSVVPKFLQRGRNRKRETRTNPHANQMQKQLDEILVRTIEDLQSCGCRELAQTTLGFAKIVDKVKGNERHNPIGSPNRILREIFIGKNKESKNFIFDCMAQASEPMLQEFGPRGLSNLIYAFGLSKYNFHYQDGSTLFDVLGEEAIPRLDDFTGQGMSNMLWAYANIGLSNAEVFEKAGEAIADKDSLEDFWPQALANIVWAYATLDETHPKLFKKVGDHIVRLDNLQPFNPQALSNVVWAFATANESNPKLYKKVGDHIAQLDNLQPFDPQALSNIVWAYATAKVSNPKMLKKVGDHVVQLDNLQSFKPQELSNIVWAYATANESHPKLFNKVGDYIVQLDNLQTYKPQHLSNIVWAFANAKESHPKLFKKVGDHVAQLDNLQAFKPQELANIVWALASLGVSHSKLFKKVGDHIVQLDNLQSFIPQDLSNIVLAYSTAKESNPSLFQKVAKAAIKKQKELNAQDIAILLWAYATNGQLDHHLFKSLTPAAVALVDKCNAQGLANIAWAYAVADVAAPSLFKDDFINACVKKENDFTTDELSQLHQWTLWQKELKSDIRLPASLETKCQDSFLSREPRPSTLQNDVVAQLKAIGLDPEEEVLTESGYRIDAVVKVNENRVAVEVDGPRHFISRRRREPTGSTILKRRQVPKLDGIPVVSVPYWEWDKLKEDSNKKQEYLRNLLGLVD